MPEKVLEVRNLVKAFAGHAVLNDVSFDVFDGEILGIMGGSGGGKSTILKLIIGLLKPESGTIRHQGVDLCGLGEWEITKIRPRIGFVFQNGALFDSMTVEENLGYPLRRHSDLSDDEIADKVNSRLRMVGLQGTNRLYPNELSGGMLKRAGLIRATMLDPRLVLMDEPTAGLDPMKVTNFIEMVRRIKRERGLSGVFVSHDADVIEAICDRVVILWNGRIAVTCRASDLRRSRDPIVRSFTHTIYDEGIPTQQAS